MSERADIFSLGVILSEMATGRRPEALPAAWLDSSSDGTTRELPVDGPDVPELLRSVLMRALAPRPQMRSDGPGAAGRTGAGGRTQPPCIHRRQRRRGRRVETRDGSQTTAAPPPPRHYGAGRASRVVLGAAGVILVHGVINSAVFNVTLGRSGFVTEGIGDWFHWGLKSVVAPGALAAMLVILFEFARTVWRFVCRRWMPGVPSSTWTSMRAST